MSRPLLPTILASVWFIIAMQCLFEGRIKYGITSAEESFLSPKGGCRLELSIQVKFLSAPQIQTARLTLMPSPSVSSDSSSPLVKEVELMPLCFYFGAFEDAKETFLANISKYGLLRSTLKFEGKWYTLSTNTTNSIPAIPVDKVNDKTATGLVEEWSGISSSHLVCQGCTRAAASQILHSRRKRALKLQSFNQLAARKILELLVVADSEYIAKFGQQGAASRIQQMLPYVNGAYQALGLQIVLVSIVSLTANQFNATQDIEKLHISFNAYKAFNINSRHDAAILLVPNMLTNTFSGVISNSTFGGSTGYLCDLVFSGGVVADVLQPMQAAWLMVRTIGILLGFQFDETVAGCACSEPIGCFMNSRKSFEPTTQLLGWSSCSLSSWTSQSDATWRECLNDAPNTSYAFPPATQCGNGIVDSGEECDCGPDLTCKSDCCDSKTCMFKAGAQCANGACCDSSTCRLKTKGQVCRYQDSACDVAETCNGSTEWCPADDKVANGVQCDNSSYCYNGACKSSTTQCKMHFGSAATVADQVCFRNLNTVANLGYCSLNLIVFNSTGFRTFRTQICAPVDSVCGLLQCWMPSLPTTGQSFKAGDSTCYSPTGTDTASSGIRNGILVPDGVACGPRAVCVNSACQSLSTFACTNCPNCHGNGNLTQARVCYCKPGFAPPDCRSAGCGGSVTSQHVCDDAINVQTTVIIAAAAVSVALLAAIAGVVGYCIHKKRAGTDGNGNQDASRAVAAANSYDNTQDRRLPSFPKDIKNQGEYFGDEKCSEAYDKAEEDEYAAIDVDPAV